MSSIAAIGLFLAVATLFCQFAVWQYGRGVVRAAALEAARAETPLGAAPGSCLRRFDDAREDLLGGALGDQVGPARCEVSDERVTATVAVAFESWLPLSPDWHFTVSAVAVRERAP